MLDMRKKAGAVEAAVFGVPTVGPLIVFELRGALGGRRAMQTTHRMQRHGHQAAALPPTYDCAKKKRVVLCFSTSVECLFVCALLMQGTRTA